MGLKPLIKERELEALLGLLGCLLLALDEGLQALAWHPNPHGQSDTKILQEVSWLAAIEREQGPLIEGM